MTTHELIKHYALVQNDYYNLYCLLQNCSSEHKTKIRHKILLVNTQLINIVREYEKLTGSKAIPKYIQDFE